MRKNRCPGSNLYWVKINWDAGPGFCKVIKKPRGGEPGAFKKGCLNKSLFLDNDGFLYSVTVIFDHQEVYTF